MSDVAHQIPPHSQSVLCPVARYTGGTTLWVHTDDTDAAQQVWLAARFSPGEVQALIDADAVALVVPVRPSTKLNLASAATLRGVVIDFVCIDAPPKRVVYAEEIRLGPAKWRREDDEAHADNPSSSSGARIYYDVDALHIAADNISSQARYAQRITGGSIKIG